MMNHLLVPLDGSGLAESALPHAILLAQAFQSQLTLLRVLDPAQMSGTHSIIDPVQWLMAKTQASHYLYGISERLDKLGVLAHTILLEGNAAEQISAYAVEQHCDLIILSSHGRSGLSRWNISTVAQQVLLDNTGSTLIVRSRHTEAWDMLDLAYKRILLPLDGSWRAECVLPPAVAVTRFTGAKLLAAHVATAPEMVRRMPPSNEDAHLASRVLDRNQAEAANYLAQLPSHLNVDYEVHLLSGSAVAVSLHQLAKEQEVDLVILSAHGASGATIWPYGSVATSFIVYGMTPVLVVQDNPQFQTTTLLDKTPVTRERDIPMPVTI